MSYLHCPQCSHAYNLAVTQQCPCCPVPATLVDPEEDIVAAADALARAMARATPAERTAAAARIHHLAPIPGSVPRPVPAVGSGGVVAKAPPSPRLLTRIAERLVDRAERLELFASAARAMLRDRAREAAPRVVALLPRRASSLLRRLAA
ncbi:MAG TPA: hypothetical protein VFQ65_14895 [Kofleriaceae bacterium]|nr:hypothetical protein [Kofleriaceae bacterium]